MIIVVSSSGHERAALTSLCESKGWACRECDSLRAVKKKLLGARPRVVLTRQKLSDGYSDDVISALRSVNLLPTTKLIVLLDRAPSTAQEARQVSLGADTVLRDPVRADVLLEYLARYLSQPSASRRNRTPDARAQPFRFAGAVIDPVERTAQRAHQSTRLTPREVQLAEVLFEYRGQVVTYATLFTEILGVQFRGDTSNLRVLLRKLETSLLGLGTTLRPSVEVIPKTGYRYTAPKSSVLRLKKSFRATQPTAA